MLFQHHVEIARCECLSHPNRDGIASHNSGNCHIKNKVRVSKNYFFCKQFSGLRWTSKLMKTLFSVWKPMQWAPPMYIYIYMFKIIVLFSCQRILRELFTLVLIWNIDVYLYCHVHLFCDVSCIHLSGFQMLYMYIYNMPLVWPVQDFRYYTYRPLVFMTCSHLHTHAHTT